MTCVGSDWLSMAHWPTGFGKNYSPQKLVRDVCTKNFWSFFLRVEKVWKNRQDTKLLYATLVMCVIVHDWTQVNVQCIKYPCSRAHNI